MSSTIGGSPSGASASVGSAGSRTLERSESWPWIVLVVLLVACLAHGLWITRDLGSYAAILDTYRDAGFIQGFLDGNLAGDPSIEGAKRYYPPLLHALGACAAFVTHMRPLDMLTRAAPWVNLLVPICFFLMVRRLVNAPAAAFAAILFVCFDGLLVPPWMAASYTPWHSVPAITQALFFASVWLISARVQRGRFIDVLGIGSAIGLVFLAHTVPALILAAITAAAALVTQGIRVRTVTWVAGVGIVAALWALPFMVPLVTAYHMKIVNAAGSFIDPMFNPGKVPTRVIAALLPGAGALAWVGWRLCMTPRSAVTGSAALSRATLVILAVWIVLPVLFMARHFGCGGGGSSAMCTAFVVPVHHWMFYLQSALACVFGYAVASATSRDAVAMSGRPALGLGSALVLGCALLIVRPMDHQMRERALDMRNRVDVPLYQWMLANTPPGALFVTDISTNAVHDSAAMAVLAAGRKSVALPFTFSNPYVDWQTRKQREEADLTAARTGTDKRALCGALKEGAGGAAVYVALAAPEAGAVATAGAASDVSATAHESSAGEPPADQLRLAFRSTMNNVYQILPSVCN